MVSVKKYLQPEGNVLYLHPQYDLTKAQVAELVDALVSNTSGSNTVPVRPRPWVQKQSEAL